MKQQPTGIMRHNPTDAGVAAATVAYVKAGDNDVPIHVEKATGSCALYEVIDKRLKPNEEILCWTTFKNAQRIARALRAVIDLGIEGELK